MKKTAAKSKPRKPKRVFSWLNPKLERDLNKRVIEKFKIYCSRCKGLCCSKEINAFNFEIKKWPKAELHLKENWLKDKEIEQSPIRRFNIGKHCPYVGKNGCVMSPSIRPIDCVSYPIYPLINSNKNKQELVGLMVHKSCPYASLMSKDKLLTSLVLQFWKSKTKKIKIQDIKTWLGNKRNYWLDKNIIKIKNDSI